MADNEIKQGVVLDGIDVKRMKPVVDAARIAYRQIAQAPIVVTSGLDGKHKTNSKHYIGHALDFRTFHVQKETIPAISNQLREILGDDYDVVPESTHIHIEYDPVGK